MNHHEMLEQCGAAALTVAERRSHRAYRVLARSFPTAQEACDNIRFAAQAGTVTVKQACENIVGWQAARKKYSGVI